MVALEKPELPKPIFIIGSGGQTRETVQLIMDINRALPRWAIMGYIDERLQLHGDIIYGYPVIGNIDCLREHLTSESRIICAIGHPKSRFNAIQQVVAAIPEARFATLVHPTAVIGDDLKIGEGTIVGAHAVLTTNVRIGNHVLVNYGATVSHDSVIESYASILPGCNISGNTVIGEGALIGAGTVVIQQKSVGHWTTVGAGSVVVKSIPDFCKAYGVPAKVVENSADSE
ncbi:acetyltransferase [Paenibacillus terreus]|uniref:Acetyltransferase n=2 Tax=Paenibacillus terreus TaxID=1387834 RepID=A0ABV5B892_9BACL